MKILKNYLSILVCIILAATAFTACEWDNSPEPEHPTYVTYTISVGLEDYIGSDELLQDIYKWIKANQKIYDKEVRYSTGAASEFASSDADALKIYETFAPKFKAYIEEVQTKLAKGEYEPDNHVNATFYIYAARTQGEGGSLKSEQVKLVYPTAQ